MLLPRSESGFIFTQIGCGGTGSYVSVPLAKYISHHQLLGGRTTLKLVDGDVFELKNLERQNFDAIAIAAPKALAIAEQIKTTLGSALNLDLEVIHEYLLESNIDSILTDDSTILLCPDNAKCRILVQEWALQKCKNVTIISAGNDYDDGQVQVMMIKNGELITPTLTQYYPELLEIAKGEKDVSEKVAGAEGCHIDAQSDPQLIFANMMAGTLMLSYIYALEKKTIDSFVTQFDLKIAGAFPGTFFDKEAESKLRIHATNATPLIQSTA